MRAVLALSLVLLGLTLALNHTRELFPVAEVAHEGADRALEIVVGGKGPLLPAAAIGTGPERIGEALRIGDRTLIGDGGSGLRAVFVQPGGGLRGERRYDIAHLAADRAALVAAVAEARAGEVLVLASSGRLEPDGGRAGWDELAATLERLGARARPGSATPESWALITLRSGRDWLPLAESYSRNSGVALATVIGPKSEAQAGTHGEFTLVRATGMRDTRLDDELKYASVSTPGLVWLREASVLGRRMAALRLPPVLEAGVSAPGRLGWNEVGIDAGSGLIVWLGIADGARVDAEGLEFEVLVDGAVVAHRRVRAGTPWRPLQADLRPFAEKSVDIELRVTAPSGGSSEGLLLGHPTLTQGYERSPLEVWAGEK